MSNIERVCQFLDDAKTYYLATSEGDQPRVRPFGTAMVYEGRLYIQTGKVKPVSRQIAANPKVEICAFHGGKWLRVAGTLVRECCTSGTRSPRSPRLRRRRRSCGSDHRCARGPAFDNNLTFRPAPLPYPPLYGIISYG